MDDEDDRTAGEQQELKVISVSLPVRTASTVS